MNEQLSGTGIGEGTSVDAGNVIVLILVLVAILFAAYYTTRLVSGKASRIMRSNRMHIVDRLAISRDKLLLIVKVGEEFYLLGVSNNQINHLANLSPEQLLEPEGEANSGSTFWGRFAGAMKENFSSQFGRAPKSEKHKAENSYEDLDSMAERARRRSERFDRRGGGEE